MDYRIDEIDRRILYHLVADARNTSAPAIAEEVDVTPGTIRNRIRQLEEHGIIRGYHASIDYEHVEGRITNLFQCTVPVPERADVAKQALEIPGVVDVTELMAGKQNLHVVGVGQNTNDITRIASALSDLGAEIEQEDLVQREYTHPYHQFAPEDERDRPSMTDFMSLSGNAEVVEVTVSEGAEVAGMTISEAADAGLLQDEVLVISVERGDTVLTPKGETVIEPGDVITVFSRDGLSAETVKRFDGHRV